MKKKCPNCLCMVDSSATVCNFCKTPFKEGKVASVIKQPNFNPPVISNHEVDKPIFTKINIAANILPPEKEVIPEESELEKELKLEESYLNQSVDIEAETEVIKAQDTAFEAIKSEKERKILEKVYEKISKAAENGKDYLYDTFDANLDALGFVEDELDFKELKKRVPQSFIETPENNPLKEKESIKFNTGNLREATRTNENIEERSFLEIAEEKETVNIPDKLLNKKADIKSVAKRIADRLNSEDPFHREPFEIDSIDIAELKDEIPIEHEEVENVKATAIDVANPDYLNELNEFAMLIAPTAEEEIKETEEIKKDTEINNKNRFDTKDVIRTSNEKIEEKNSPAPPVKNVREAISTLESLKEELEKDIENEDLDRVEKDKTEEISEKPLLIEQSGNLFDLSDLEGLSRELQENKLIEAEPENISLAETISLSNEENNLFSEINFDSQTQEETPKDNHEKETKALLLYTLLNQENLNKEKDAEAIQENKVEDDQPLESGFSLESVNLSDIVNQIQNDNLESVNETLEVNNIFSNRLKKFAKHDIDSESEQHYQLDEIKSIENNIIEEANNVSNEINIDSAEEEIIIPPANILDLLTSVDETLEVPDKISENKEETSGAKKLLNLRLKKISKVVEESSEDEVFEMPQAILSLINDEAISEEIKPIENKEQDNEIGNSLSEEINIPDSIKQVQENSISVIEEKTPELKPEELKTTKDKDIDAKKPKIEEEKEIKNNLPVRVESLAETLISKIKIEAENKVERNIPNKAEVKNELKPQVKIQQSQHIGARSTTNELAMSYYNVAKDYCVKRDYEKALIELENAVKLDPAFEQAHILLSRTYLKLKNAY